MSTTQNPGHVPIQIKTEQGLPWPKDAAVFYVLGKDGLFICRNHPFFRSCVRARQWPSSLERQGTFLSPSYPTIPQGMFERVVGFFDLVGEEHGAEASVLLYWDREEECVHTVVPEQKATVSRSSKGYQHPIGLHYTPPTDVAPHWILFGDVHSHVNLSAYSSDTDVEDEAFSAGLHIVVGKINREPPDISVEAVVDGTRFRMDPPDVIEGYEARDHDVPAEWLERLEVEVNPWSWTSGSTWTSSVGRDGGVQSW